jgi:anti-anti-sigma factor
MAVQQHLQIAVRHEGDLCVLHLDGELDLASAPLFQEELDSQGVRACTRLVLDMRDLRFIDSTGLRIIFSAHAHALERGQEFAVTRGSEQVQRLLTITRMGEHLRVIDAPEDLLERSSSGS